MKKSGVKFTAILVMLFIAIFNISAFAKTGIPLPTSRFFINDYANVIDSETENYIYETGKAYNENGGLQIVVLTMESVDGAAIEDFSVETARDWEIGNKEKNNGVLILLVTGSRDIRIEVGYGLESILTDRKCGRFIRNAKDKLSSGDYSGGIKQIYDEILAEIEEPTPDEEDDDFWLEIGFYAIILIVLFAIISILGRHSGGGNSGGHWHGGFGGFGGFGSRGGFGGGGFSGGGGSFGGGGASGKF